MLPGRASNVPTPHEDGIPVVCAYLEITHACAWEIRKKEWALKGAWCKSCLVGDISSIPVGIRAMRTEGEGRTLANRQSRHEAAAGDPASLCNGVQGVGLSQEFGGTETVTAPAATISKTERPNSGKRARDVPARCLQRFE